MLVAVCVCVCMPFRLGRSGGGGGGDISSSSSHHRRHGEYHDAGIARNAPLVTSYSACWFFTAIFLFIGVIMLSCTSCWESTTTTTTTSTKIKHPPTTPLPSPSPSPNHGNNNSGGEVIMISAHAEASATSSTDTTVIVTKNTATDTVTPLLPILPEPIVKPKPLSSLIVRPKPLISYSSSTKPLISYSSSSSSSNHNATDATFHMAISACNAIRLHQTCCDATLTKYVLPHPFQLNCNQLYHGNGAHFGFKPCNATKPEVRACCKACTPACMSCSWNIPLGVYSQCYGKHYNGCPSKCGSVNTRHISSGLCPPIKKHN